MQSLVCALSLFFFAGCALNPFGWNWTAKSGKKYTPSTYRLQQSLDDMARQTGEIKGHVGTSKGYAERIDGKATVILEHWKGTE